MGGLPKGRLFPVSRDDLVECTAMLDSVRREELDRLVIPNKPLDVLAQQIAAEVACGEYFNPVSPEQLAQQLRELDGGVQPAE